MMCKMVTKKGAVGCVLCLVLLGLCLSGLALGQPDEGNRKKLRRSGGWLKKSTDSTVELPKLSLKGPLLDGKLNATDLGLKGISLDKLKLKKGTLRKHKVADGEDKPLLKKGIFGGLSLPKLRKKGKLSGLRAKLEKLLKGDGEEGRKRRRFGKLGSLSLKKIKKPGQFVKSLKKRKAGSRALQAEGEHREPPVLFSKKLRVKIPVLKNRKGKRGFAKGKKLTKAFGGKFRRPFFKKHSLKNLGKLLEKRLPKLTAKFGKKRFGGLRRRRFGKVLKKKPFGKKLEKKIDIEALGAIAKGVGSGLKALLIEKKTGKTGEESEDSVEPEEEPQQTVTAKATTVAARRLEDAVMATLLTQAYGPGALATETEKNSKGKMTLKGVIQATPAVSAATIQKPRGDSKVDRKEKKTVRKQKKGVAGQKEMKRLSLKNLKVAQLEGELEDRMEELEKKIQAKLAALEGKVEKLGDGKMVDGKMKKKLKRINGSFVHKFDKLNGRLAHKLEKIDGKMSDKLGSVDGKLVGRLDRFDGKISDRLNRLDGRLSDKLKKMDGRVGDKKKTRKFKLDRGYFKLSGLKKKFSGLKEKFSFDHDKKRRRGVFLRKDGEGKRFGLLSNGKFPAKLKIPFTHHQDDTEYPSSSTTTASPDNSYYSSTTTTTTTTTTSGSSTTTVASTSSSTTSATTTSPETVPSTIESQEADRIAGVFHQLIGDADDGARHSHLKATLKLALDKLQTGSIDDAREVIVEQEAHAEQRSAVSALDLFDSAVRAANEVSLQAR